MESKINDILYKLQDGVIDVNKSIKEIDSVRYDIVPIEESKKMARKLKVFINTSDDGKSFKLNLPGIPFWLLKMFCGPIAKMIIKQNSGNEEKAKNINADDLNKFKFIFQALGQMPPFEIVNIDSKDAKIQIYTK